MLSGDDATTIPRAAWRWMRQDRDWDRLQTALGELVLETLSVDGAAVVVRGAGDIPHLSVRLLTAPGEERSFRIQAENNVAAWVLAHGEGAYVEDVYLDDRYGNEFPHGLGIQVRSLAAAPLTARGETFGVLEALKKKEDGLSSQDIEHLTWLADWTAPVAAYASELWQARQQVEELETLMEAAIQVGSTLELETLWQTIPQLAQQLARAEASSLLLREPETSELVFYAALGEKGEEVKQFRLQLGEGIAGWVVQRGEPALVSDASLDPRFRRDISERIHFPAESILCVPLKIERHTIGAIEVINSVGRDSFDEHDLRRLTMLAQQTAPAIQNAQQFEALRQRLNDAQVPP